MPLPSHFQQSNRNLPRRVDSLKAPKGPNFSELEDELRDIRRVHLQGQEEDLRYALNRTINRIEELSSMLKEAYKAQADLQTELTLAKSNLQMALANNEMLEDALKRDPGSSREVGWRRSATGVREQALKAEADGGAGGDRRRSTDSYTSSAELASSSSPTFPHASPTLTPAPEPSPMGARATTAPSPAPPTSEGRFFRFRFGSASTPSGGSHPNSPRLPGTASPSLNGAHLTSASLPSLVPSKDVEKEVEELQKQLEKERKAHKAATEAKAALEAELESLSQALFEEANKMVATERRKLAETEDALREAREQGEALKNVLRIVERDNERTRTSSDSAGPGEAGPSAPVVRTRHRATSSAVGIKSLPASGAASPRSYPASPALPSSELPESSSTLGKAPSSVAPVEEEEGDRTLLAESSADDSTAERPPLGDPSESVKSDALRPSPSPSPSRSPTPSPGPSPLSEPGQFLFSKPRPVDYFDGEESPWADATSAASPRVSLS
ncbi:hypothetical protein BD413DRAFT_613951 [Trametes elegans]|nr:hypothetical protein BD413DRAFT_613951 [Trametes elegans]